MRHLLSLERIIYYIYGPKVCQAINNGFFLFYAYSCLAAFILTPGPMVEAHTQDLIY